MGRGPRQKLPQRPPGGWGRRAVDACTGGFVIRGLTFHSLASDSLDVQRTRPAGSVVSAESRGHALGESSSGWNCANSEPPGRGGGRGTLKQKVLLTLRGGGYHCGLLFLTFKISRLKKLAR